MEVIKDMFPHMSQDVLQGVLEECGGNVERAIDCLLNMDAISEATPTPSSHPASHLPLSSLPLPSSHPTPYPTFHPTPHPSSSHPSSSPDQQMSQMELDEMLARELASSSYFSSDYTHPPRRQPQEVHTMALDNIDPTVMAEIINGVKSGMIPILMKELKSLDIPGVNEKIDAGKLGTINVTLDQIGVSEANVPEENITVAVEGSDITIAVRGIVATLQQFKWGYEKLSFPKVKDSGNADASISEATVDVKLRIGGDEYGNPSLAVTNCKVNIGKLDFKISGSLASFVYNTLLAIFKKTIKQTLETNFEQMIISSVNDSGSMNLF